MRAFFAASRTLRNTRMRCAFASRDPGVKYFKMMVIQGVHAVHAHLEAAADQARAGIRSRAALADPYIAAAKSIAGSHGQ